MLGEFFFRLFLQKLMFGRSIEAAFLFLSHIVTHRARAEGGLSTGNFKDSIIYADILRELEFIAGVIKLRKICIFVVYLY